MATKYDLMQERYQLCKKALTLGDKAEKEERANTAAESKEIDRLSAEIDRIGKAIDGKGTAGRSLQQLLTDMEKIVNNPIIENVGGERRINGGMIFRGKDGLENRMITPKDSFIDDRFMPADLERADFDNSLGRMLLAKVRPGFDELNSIEGRALAEGAVAGGGFMAPVQTSQQIWEAARVNMATARAGVNFMTMASKELDLIRQDADAVSSWVQEGVPIPESTAMAFSRMKLNLKKTAVIVNVDKELVLDSPNAASIITDSINYAVAKALDYAVLYGQGASEQPQGLYYDANITGITDLGAAAAFTFDSAIDATYAILANNCPAIAGLAMLMAPAQKKVLDKMRGNDGTYLIGDVSSIPQSVNWARCFPTQQISATAGYPGRDVFIGAFDQYLIGAGQNVEILNTEYTSDQWSKYQISFRAVLRADGGCMRPTWFYIYKNAN